MGRHGIPIIVMLGSALAAAAATIPGNATRGQQLFTSQRCVRCHSVNGQGGSVGPELARRPDSFYTPTMLAAAIWNHAPAMWTAMEAAGIERPRLTPEQSADLFAYFYAFRYFELPGDAGRGKRVFDSRGCVGCHATSADGPTVGPPIQQWQAVSDPIELARQMWNHAPRMREAMAGKTWPELSAQEMTDLVVYLRNVPSQRNAERSFAPASGGAGEDLFKAKGCTNCHTGANTLHGKLSGMTMAGFAAAMWNHAPQMRASAAEIGPQEMTRLVGYLWSIQFFDEAGDAARGSRVANQVGCAACHGVEGNPAPAFRSLAGGLDPISFVSATWQHGPAMWDQMKAAGKAWPRFERRELNDLLAYINSL